MRLHDFSRRALSRTTPSPNNPPLLYLPRRCGYGFVPRANRYARAPLALAPTHRYGGDLGAEVFRDWAHPALVRLLRDKTAAAGDDRGVARALARACDLALAVPRGDGGEGEGGARATGDDDDAATAEPLGIGEPDEIEAELARWRADSDVAAADADDDDADARRHVELALEFRLEQAIVLSQFRALVSRFADALDALDARDAGAARAVAAGAAERDLNRYLQRVTRLDLEGLDALLEEPEFQLPAGPT